MKIVVAPDSYKGCLSADEVAAVMAEAINMARPDWEIVQLPLADGGEGTVDILARALGGRIHETEVSDPLGRRVKARFALTGPTAVVEVAEACGLRLLEDSERDPLIADTYGVGELLIAARNAGAEEFLIGLGGTATCDGGAGMMRVPGIRKALTGCSFTILCDVDNPFTGKNGAARVFAPQKGASESDVEILEARMEALAQDIKAETGIDIRDLPGAGAAGGLGGAFMAWFRATRKTGIDCILEKIHFAETIKGAGLIITGEGCSDRQTLHGKVPFGVLKHSRGIPVALISGRIEDRESLESAGFSAMAEVSPRTIQLSEAISPDVAKMNIGKAVKTVLTAL